jgi:energy-coupling factor transporter ATP-binding protein EcfA2
MAHSLIVGMSESGKTTLARQLSHILHKGGHKVIVLDEMQDPGWAADFITDDNDQFLEVFWANRECFVFIDEAGNAVGKYDDAMRQTATQGRHWGHSCFYISQRGALLSATVRGQCRHLYLFASPVADCKIYAHEFNRPELMKACELPQGQYYHVKRFEPKIEIGRVF